MNAPVVIASPLDAEYAVEPLDTDLDFDAASDLVKRVRNLLSDIQDQLEETSNSITRLYHGRAWRSLGYASWEELCLAKFPIKLKLPSAERKELVVTIRKLGLSQSAIADVVGVDQKTVSNDLKAATQEDSSVDLPTETTGKDGKVRAAKKAPTTFVCPRCEKRRKLESRVEIDGVDHCEPCAEALEQAAAHAEETTTDDKPLTKAQEKTELWTEIRTLSESGRPTKARVEKILAKAEALLELLS